MPRCLLNGLIIVVTSNLNSKQMMNLNLQLLKRDAHQSYIHTEKAPDWSALSPYFQREYTPLYAIEKWQTKLRNTMSQTKVISFLQNEASKSPAPLSLKSLLFLSISCSASPSVCYSARKQKPFLPLPADF